MLSPGCLMVWVACNATLVHGDIQDYTAAEGHVWVRGSLNLGLFVYPMLPRKATQRSVVC